MGKKTFVFKKQINRDCESTECPFSKAIRQQCNLEYIPVAEDDHCVIELTLKKHGGRIVGIAQILPKQK